MDTEVDQTTPGQGSESVLSNDQYGTALYFVIILTAIPTILGVITNILNIWVFLRMRLQDSVTISFFALSISDLCIVVTLLVMCGCGVFMIIDIQNNFVAEVDPEGIAFIVGEFNEVFLLTSSLFTSYLAVTRCMCVVLPFRFKLYFTRNKTVIILSLLSFPCIAHLAMFTQMEVQWTTLADNTTRQMFKYVESTHRVASFYSDMFMF